jgi:hypothetical protein
LRALTKDPVKANQEWGFYASAYNILNDSVKIDGWSIDVRLDLNISTLVDLEVSSAPTLDSVLLAALRNIP